MRKRDALKLHNRDEVEVKIDGKWSPGYILGDPKEESGRVILPVQSPQWGYIQVDHTDIR
jgi:hypothetical protein